MKETRKEFKKLVIEAIHGLPYEEAIKKELVFNCRLVDKEHQFFGKNDPTPMILISSDYPEVDTPFELLHYRGNPLISFSEIEVFNKERCEIIGLPITIGRVMEASINADIDLGPILDKNWKLTKENGQERTDDDQSDETIKALYLYLTNNK